MTWDNFEPAPFCVLNYDDKNPNANPNVISNKATAHFTTKCNVPARSGHHVIYGEWGRLPPTNERFHGCIDGNFGGQVPDPVVAVLSATPANTTVVGAGTLALTAAASRGTNLRYQWSLESPNNALYSFSNTTSVNTTLTFKNPQALTNFTVRLTVSSGENVDSAALVFVHTASTGSSWTDLGVLTATPVNMTIQSRVNLRLVGADGKDTFLPNLGLSITRANSLSNAWPAALAQAVNSGDGKVQIGLLANGVITPVKDATSNRVYALSPSAYVSAFLNVVNPNASSSRASSSKAVVSSLAQSSAKSSVVASSKRSSSVASETGNCSYVVTSQWNTGFVATIRITNKRTSPMNGWSVNWNYSDGSKITNSWSTTLAGTNPYTGTNVSYNAVIQPGQFIEFGFQGNKGSSPTPLVPLVTGAVCN